MPLLALLVLAPLVINDLQERDEDDEDNEEEHENEGLLNLFESKFILLEESRLPAHNLTDCLDLRMKFSGNLNETLRTLPTQ